MENFKFISHSQPATPASMIHSPSPLRKATVSRISSNVARELFSAVPEQTETDPFKNNDESPSNFMKAKFMSLKVESDSSSNEWSSDSGLSNCLDLDCESPRKQILRNPFNQDQIFGDLAFEVPSRASNPVVNDTQFNNNKKSLFGHSSRLAMPSRAEGRLADFI